MDEARLVVITGIMASGKSTIAQALAERLPASAHVRGDHYRRSIVNGREEMSADPTDRALGQLRLRYQLALSAAEQYRRAGFTAIVQDVILGPLLTEFVAMVDHRPFSLVVLAPQPTEVARREKQRAKAGYGTFTPEQLDVILRADTPRLGYWLDSTDLTVDQTVDQILANLDGAARIDAPASRPQTQSPAAGVRLRPVQRTDLRWLAEVACDPSLTGEHNWGGEQRDIATVLEELETDFERGGLAENDTGTFIVCLSDGTRIGDVSWRTEQWGPSARSRCPAIGINLLPEYRGRGLGTAAQRLIVDYLFERDPLLHRVQSDTAVDNPAERRALAKIGMIEEGLVRSAEFRGGRFHDHVLFSVLRSEWSPNDQVPNADA